MHPMHPACRFATQRCAAMRDMPVGKLNIEGFDEGERLEDNIFYYYETFTFTPDNINDFDF